MRRAGREWPDLMAHWPFTSCLVGRTSLGAAAYVLSCDKHEALMSLQACIPELQNLVLVRLLALFKDIAPLKDSLYALGPHIPRAGCLIGRTESC